MNSHKIKQLKTNADNIKSDKSLRHTPNKHDIRKVSENTKLLHTHQRDTIKGE